MRILCILGLASLGIFVAGAQTGKSSPEASAAPAPPPSAAAKVSAADLEKLVAPIALYPDSLIATLLPASVYPLEVVQAARFIRDTNNLAKLDEQPWDENVKAVARIPEVIQQMDGDIAWMSRLGEAFLAQDKDVMDAIQAMRGKAQKAGTLQTTPQQVVVVTNMVVEKTIEQQVVVVTNTIVQIQPSNPQVIYVPTYNPYTVYYPPPAYVYNPVAPLVTFGMGVAVGAIIANNCDWHHGGCYNGNVNINVNNNYNRNVNNNFNQNNNINRGTSSGQKWQPDQGRLNQSGATSTASRDARGWSGGSTQPGAGTRPTASTGAAGARPSTGTAAARPSTGTTSARPSPSPSPSRSAAPSSVNRSSGGSGGSAFSGMSSGSSTRSTSSRGAASRGGGGGGGGGRSGGGGGRR